MTVKSFHKILSFIVCPVNTSNLYILYHFFYKNSILKVNLCEKYEEFSYIFLTYYYVCGKIPSSQVISAGKKQGLYRRSNTLRCCLSSVTVEGWQSGEALKKGAEGASIIGISKYLRALFNLTVSRGFWRCPDVISQAKGRRKCINILLHTFCVSGELFLALFIFYERGYDKMSDFLSGLANFNDTINSFVWGKGLYLLLGTGILMTILTGVFQITHIGHWFKETLGSVFNKHVSGHTKNRSISQFQALCTALAATIGVGNIAGVAAAITGGGRGAVFWMWLAAFFGMMTNYSENVLGIYYRRKNDDGEWSGGAMYYLQDGLGAFKGCRGIGKVLAVLFAIFCILASFGIGNMGQINKIVTNFTSAFNISVLNSHVLYSGGGTDITLYNLVLGILLVILGGLIIIGGLKRIANFAEKVVPFMVVAFVLGSLVVILVNVQHVGAAFSAIFKSAFTPKAMWGGAEGIAVSQIIIQGCKRGVFSNEAGLGSSVMVHSSSNVKEPVRQGMWGIFEVFADTMVVCTMTALVILTSGVMDLQTGMLAEGVGGDATLVAKAFETIFGGMGSKFISIAILLFAFTTVLGWSHYGSKAVEYLGGKKAVKVYKVIFVLMIISGALLTSSLAWDISDTFNGLMMIPNLIGVICLSGLVMKITKNYVDRKLKNKDIKPMLSVFPDIQEEMIKELEKIKK